MNIKPIDTLMKKEDDTQTFKVQMLDDNNAPFKLTDSAGLEIDIELAPDVVLQREVEVIDPANGIVEIDMHDLKAGSYNCEIILREGEEVQTFPTNGYFAVQINKNLPKE